MRWCFLFYRIWD